MKSLHTRKTLLMLVFVIAFVSALLLAPVLAKPVQAQESGPKIECDTSLVTLLIVAEKDYDYLSDLMMMKKPLPNIDYGPYEKLVKAYIAMMVKIPGTGSSLMMTEEPGKMMTEEAMTTEEPVMRSGDIADEDPGCARIRADVEKYLIDHMMADVAKAGM